MQSSKCINITASVYLNAIIESIVIHPPLKFQLASRYLACLHFSLRHTLSIGFEESQNRRSVARRITLSGSWLMVDA